MVYVINKDGEPLMPCTPVIARLLLKQGKAKVKSRDPFTIKLLYEATDHVQPVTAGMDTGSKKIGCAAITNGKVVYQSEVSIRNDVSSKMKRRAMYRCTSRSRKTRYRPARWANRAASRCKGRLAPSIRSKVESHLREKKQVEAILPVSHWKVETASFDIHKISDPEVRNYQNGNKKGFYNVKAYVLNRDGYKCQSGQKCSHSKKLHVHHIVFRSQGGTDESGNLTTLCENCHKNLHGGKFEIKGKRSKTKHATQVGIIKSQLKKIWDFEETFGYETKFKRENVLHFSKTHYNDAVAICCGDGEVIKTSDRIVYKRHVSAGDYQQTKGIRSEKKIPTGKLFEFRKHDLLKTSKGIGFVKGKRSTGHFSISDLFGNVVSSSVNIKKTCSRISARSTTLNETRRIPNSSTA